jgi:ferredoxin
VQPVPAPVDDVAATTDGAAVAIDVLANDAGGLGSLDHTTLTMVNPPAHGTAVAQTDHTILYAPTAGYAGADSFSYQVCDAGGGCRTATVSVTIAASPAPPPAFANGDAVVVMKAASKIIAVLANDGSSGALVPSTVSIIAPPSHGTAVANADGTITFTASGSYVGSDLLRYQVCDTSAACTQATVSIVIVAGGGGRAFVVADAAVTAAGQAVVVRVLDNDRGESDKVLVPSSVLIVSAPSAGTVSIAPDGSITYVPAPGFAGTDDFSYSVCDAGNHCGVAVVVVTVLPSGSVTAPSAVGDAAITARNAFVKIAVLENDLPGTGGPIDPATLVITTAPVHGVATVNADDTITYTPSNDYLGADVLSYTVCSTSGECSTATVALTVVKV